MSNPYNRSVGGFPIYLSGVLTGMIIGILIASNVTDSYWHKKLIKDGTYTWIADPQTGATLLVKKP